MFIRCGAAAAALLLATSTAHAQHGAAAQNMALLGHHDLQGRSAYQPFIKESRGRWIAYIGHHGGRALNALTGREEDNGTSLVDVTDPRRPRYLAHIPGEPGQAESGGAQMVRVCNGKDLPKGARIIQWNINCCLYCSTERSCKSVSRGATHRQAKPNCLSYDARTHLPD